MNIVNITELNSLDSSTIVTVGMFDGVHIGHRHLIARLLDSAKRRVLRPVVITFDRHPREVLGGNAVPMLTTVDERVRMIRECGVKDVVVVDFSRELALLSACEFVEKHLLPRLNMKCLLLGYDNMFGRRTNSDFSQLPSLASRLGFEIITDTAVVSDGTEVSSSTIRKALADGNIELANKLLGYHYSIEGEVVHGRMVGRTMGFPTANVSVDMQKPLPHEGVYALRVTTDGTTHLAMANIGPRPTFELTTPVVEVHIIGFEGDLYGCTLTMELLGKLRKTQRFASQKDLETALRHDLQTTIERYTDVKLAP